VLKWCLLDFFGEGKAQIWGQAPWLCAGGKFHYSELPVHDTLLAPLYGSIYVVNVITYKFFDTTD